MSKKGTTGKTISDTLMEYNFSDLVSGKVKPSTEGMAKVVSQMGDYLAYQMLEGTVADVELKNQERMMRRAQLQQQQASVMGGVTPGTPNPMQEFTKGLSNPEFLAMWNSMNPEQQQNLMNQLANMQMMTTPYSAAAYQSMMPYMMLMQMQQGKGEAISVKDLAAMFTTGVETAMKAIPQPKESDYKSVVDVVSNLTQPFKEMARESDRRNWDLIIKALEEKKSEGTFRDKISEIKEVVEIFGGGSATEADIRITQIQADQALQIAKLNADVTLRAEELRQEQSKYDQLGGFLATALAGAGPTIAQGFKSLGQRHAQEQPSIQPGGAADKRAPFLRAQCSECGKEFQIPIRQDGSYPRRVVCPFCNSELEASK